ncbi:MAG: hypothetical protein U5K36_13595 [Roseovarius sp.]|nr:hypothetical protein [Roseovarius sp.]
MLGLVLWCDAASGRAVIWCEDHGDLAWYEAESAAAAPVRAGDLVRVGLDGAGAVRRAHALWIVARGAGAGLPQRLSQAAARQAAGAR